MMTHEQNSAPASSSWSELMGGIATDMRQLVAAHGAQIQSEMSAELGRAEVASTWVVCGMMGVWLGVQSLLVGLGMVLIEVWSWPAWAACLLISLLATGAGAVLWLVGRLRWSRVNMLPRQSLNSIQESLTCLAKPAM